MSSLVVVAIPNPDDYVWNISSEKVPHLTLMFLGEQTDSFDVTKAFNYIAHAAGTSLHRFGMDVERRGVLGPEEADVLFFGKHNRKKLEEFRSYLLADSDIFKAYNSASQFPFWVPQLTLGFPATPAKPDKREWPGTSWVNFNRIALWTGNSEGPEVLLKNEDLGEVSMSDEVGIILDHFGTKGMKWGVRKTRSSGSRKPVGRTKTSPDHSATEKLRKNKKKTLTNEELAIVIKRKNLEQQFSNVNPSKFAKGQAIVKAVVATVGTVSSVVALASSPAGKAAVTAAKAVLKK